MDLTSLKSGSSSDISHSSSLSAKLKRLQIEESLLLQSINKCVSESSQTDSDVDATSYLTLSEFKAFSLKTKSSFREIKLLFQDIKNSTSSKEILKSLDIDEIKRNTLELETRIKAFKTHLHSELAGLKSDEQQLTNSINENPVLIHKIKKQPRIQTAKYNEIVPSPVKTMMTSPFKCLEVQEFQEFMQNSGNRYGGWHEYHHNIFVNHWQKHFGTQHKVPNDGENEPVTNSLEFNLFLDELLPKLQDVSEEEVISHVKWYSKYIDLKERQQKAIDKWRSNRKVMKSIKTEPEVKKDSIKNKSKGRPSIHNDITISEKLLRNKLDLESLDLESCSQGDVRRFVRKCLSDDTQLESFMDKGSYNSSLNSNTSDEQINEKTMLHFQKPTKQWDSKARNNNNIDIKTN